MRKFRYSRIPILVVVMVISSAAFQTALAQKAKPKPTPKVIYYTVKTGTTFRVRLENEISSKTARVGDPIRTTTVDPVYSSGGVLLIPAGSMVNGSVDSVARAAKNGKPGSFGANFTSVTLPNKRRVAIIGMPVPLGQAKNNVDNEGTVTANKTSNRHLKFIGGGAAGGAIIGGIAGGGTGALIGAGVGAVGGLVGKNLSKGKDAEVKPGTEFGVYLSKGIALPKYAGHQ
jgi:hypothetical protein